MTVRRLPERGDAFADARGQGRAMRVTQHAEDGVIVFSLWLHEKCTGTFRLPVEDTGRLIALLAGGLTEQLLEQLGARAPRPTDEAGSGG